MSSGPARMRGAVADPIAGVPMAAAIRIIAVVADGADRGSGGEDVPQRNARGDVRVRHLSHGNPIVGVEIGAIQLDVDDDRRAGKPPSRRLDP